MRVTLLAVVAAALVLPAAVQAATTNFTIPIEFDIAACNGDTIELSGQLLGVFTATANSAGGFLLATQVEPQGVRGVDLQTGTKFRGTGVTRDMTVVSASATSTFTSINRFHIQATAGAQSYDVSETLHVTALADGTVTAFVDNFSASC